MATYYDQLVAKGVAKGLSPERAAAAAGVKLEKEGVSIMAMPTATEAAAAPSRSALVAKGKAAGLPAERAEAAADIRLERDAQKEFAKGGDFSAAVQRARAVGTEAGAGEVVAEVLGPKKSLLPAVGAEGSEAVYAMPAPRPAAPVFTRAPLAAYGVEPYERAKAAYSRFINPEGLVPVEELPVEEQTRIEELRREEAQGRAETASTYAMPLVALAPLGAPARALAPAVAAGLYASQRLLPGKMTPEENLLRSPAWAEQTQPRPVSTSEEALKAFAGPNYVPPTKAPGGLSEYLAAGAPRLEEDTSLAAADKAAARARSAGSDTLFSDAARFFGTAVEGIPVAASAIGEGISTVAGGAADAASYVGGGIGRGVFGAVDAISRTTLPSWESNQRLAENYRLIREAPDRYVPVGPTDSPASVVASPEDAVFLNPSAFAEYEKKFPQQAAEAKTKAEAAVAGESRVTALGLDMPEPALVRAVQAGQIPTTLPSYLRSELGRGDAAAQVRAFKADPQAFKARARDNSIAMGTLPPAYAFEGDFTPVEYVAFTVAGRPIGTYEDGSLQLSELGRSSLDTLLRFRKTSPSTYLDMLKTEVEMAQAEQEPE